MRIKFERSQIEVIKKSIDCNSQTLFIKTKIILGSKRRTLDGKQREWFKIYTYSFVYNNYLIWLFDIHRNKIWNSLDLKQLKLGKKKRKEKKKERTIFVLLWFKPLISNSIRENKKTTSICTYLVCWHLEIKLNKTSNTKLINQSQKINNSSSFIIIIIIIIIIS